MVLKHIPAIAVVLTDRDVLLLRKDSLKDADLIELRVDMFEETQEIEDIFATAKRKFNLPILGTVRSNKEGGKKKISHRLNIYEKLVSYCDFFDIEIFSDEAQVLRQLSEKHNIKLIVSYHRFDLTPKLNELESVLEEGKKLKADIVKIATMINEKEDIERLLLFLLNYKNDKVIVIGMGQKGRVTRVIYPVFGSMITYASLKTLSAPGQIDLQSMVRIFRELGIR